MAKSEPGGYCGCLFLVLIVVPIMMVLWPLGWGWSVLAFLILMTLYGLTLPGTKCEVCGNPLRNSRATWKIEGKKHRVCRHCNERLERKQSRKGIDDL